MRTSDWCRISIILIVTRSICLSSHRLDDHEDAHVPFHASKKALSASRKTLHCVLPLLGPARLFRAVLALA